MAHAITEARSESAIASIVIPAHNEEAVIRRCLANVLADARPGELDIVVACNGCEDRTAAIAASFSPAVRVVEVATASKIAALNLGDQTTQGFPRLYVDADVELSTESVRQLVRALYEPGVMLAEPTLELDLTGASPVIRAQSRAWLMLAREKGAMVGTGVLALSAAGRGRFGLFPDVIAEDLFVRNLFGPHEKRVVRSATSTVRPPRNMRSFVRVKSRVAAANERYWRSNLPRFNDSRQSRLRTFLSLVRRPTCWPDAAAYIGLAAAVRLNTSWAGLRGRKALWERDETSRGTTAQNG
jgi:glycosyltransferase involved in cell wall biosynthesis